MQLDLRIFSFFFTAGQTFEESHCSIMLSWYMCLLSVQRTFLTFPHPGLALDGMDVLLTWAENAFFSCDAFYEWADISQYFHQEEREDKAGFHIQVQFPRKRKQSFLKQKENLLRNLHSPDVKEQKHDMQDFPKNDHPGTSKEHSFMKNIEILEHSNPS